MLTKSHLCAKFLQAVNIEKRSASLSGGDEIGRQKEIDLDGEAKRRAESEIKLPLHGCGC